MNSPFFGQFSVVGAYTISTSNGPVEPFAYADFQNDTYMLDGGASTFDAFLWSDADNWNAFDPANFMVAGEGLVAGDAAGGPAVTPALVARLLASGFTARIDWQSDDVNASKIQLALADEPAFNNFWDSEFRHQQTTPGENNSLIATANTPSFALPDIGFSACRIAVTWNANGCHYSINGGSVVGVDDTLDLSMVNAVLMSFSSGTWRGIGFYPPQANADLPTISTP